MAKKRILDLRWPVAGLDRSLAYRAQPPFTTPDCLNVRADDLFKDRERGGSRPGLVSAINNTFCNGPVRVLAKVALDERDEQEGVTDTGYRAKAWPLLDALPDPWAYDEFHTVGSGTFDDDGWKATNTNQLQISNTLSDYDETKAAKVSIYIPVVSSAGNVATQQGTYSIWWKGVTSGWGRADLVLADGVYSGSWEHGAFSSGFSSGFLADGVFSGDTADPMAPGWFTAHFDGVGNINFYWLGIYLGSVSSGATDAGVFAVGHKATSYSASSYSLIDAVRMEWSTTDLRSRSRHLTLAICGGVLYRQDVGDTMTAADPGTTIRFSDTELTAVDYQQKLYIADYGRLKESTTGRLAPTIYKNFTDTDGTDFGALGVTTDYRLIITDSDFSQNARQRVQLSFTDGGTFTIGYGGFSTTPIAWNASEATIQTAIDALATIGPGNTEVTGGADDFIVEFKGVFAGTAVSTLVGDASALTYTGAETPQITISELQEGLGGTALAGSYEISSVSGTTITLSESPAPAVGISSITGIEYTIDIPPKVYDPATDTLSVLVANEGQGPAPHNNRIVTVYNDRLAWAGDTDGVGNIFLSRMGDPLDYDYGATDSAGAFAVVASADSSRTPEPITALIPHSDQCMIIGCYSSLWIMRGDPGFGGVVDVLSYEIGIVGPHAWARVPSDLVCFLSQDGLYMFPAHCHGDPSSLSAERVPQELKCIDPANATVSMAWDINYRGVFLYIARESSGENDTDWFFDWEAKSFWPDAYHTDHKAFCAMSKISDTGECDQVYVGCRDGGIRKYDSKSGVDDGQKFSSYIVIGPFRVGSNDYIEGVVLEVLGVLGDKSGSVAWDLLAAQTHEAAVASTSSKATGTWNRVGLNFKARPIVRGYSAALKLSNGADGVRWTVERIGLVNRDAGALIVRD